MKRETKIALFVFLFTASLTFAAISKAENRAIVKRITDQPRSIVAVESVTEKTRCEIVTGMCTFGGCPFATLPATEMSFANTTEPETQSKTEQFAKNVQITPDNTPKNVQATETDAVVKESLTTELVSDSYTFDEPVTESRALTESRGGYIGTMYVTGYTAEEGFYEGSPTASGVGAGPGTCAMNNSQRRSLGIKYGDRIYVEGLGAYTVTNCGCDWDVVDIWLYTNAEAYAITGYYNVYYS